MVSEARDPLGSMGNDSALACLSDKPRMIYDYFKQLFAQVTNPPIDSIREEVIMSLECYIGPESNLLETTPEHVHRLELHHPIISNDELATIKNIEPRWLEVEDHRHHLREGGRRRRHAGGARPHLRRSRRRRSRTAIRFVILSDRNISARPHAAQLADRLRRGAPSPGGAGTNAPASASSWKPVRRAKCITTACWSVTAPTRSTPTSPSKPSGRRCRTACWTRKPFPTRASIVYAYKKGVAKGMLKVMAKMGISTLQSYKGAQIFEAVGLADDIIDRCFVGTASRVQGVNFAVLSEEMKQRHEIGYPGARPAR